MNKPILLLSAFALCGFSAFSQTEPDTTQITLGGTRVVIINDGDTLSADSTSVDFNGDSSEELEDELRDQLTFFSGLDLGMNLLVNASGSTDLSSTANWLQLDYARSLSWRLNLLEQKIPLYKNYVGVLVGAGLTYNSYGFRNNVDVVSNTEAFPDTIFGQGIPAELRDYTKNKLRVTYLQVPVMLEVNTSENPKRSFHIAAGVIGGWKIGSITKQEYTNEGNDIRLRAKQDFNLTPLTLDASVRVGYGKFTLFGSYGLTPLFRNDRGPEVYSMTVGLQVVPF
jgi:hypothetical protein